MATAVVVETKHCECKDYPIMTRHITFIAASLVFTSVGYGQQVTAMSNDVIAGIEKARHAISSYSMAYDVRYGVVDRAKVLANSQDEESAFAPLPSGFHMVGKYAKDLIKGDEFLSEETFTNGSSRMEVDLVHDDIGSALLSVDDTAHRWQGRLMEGPPSAFRKGWQGHWRPSDALYWGVLRRDLLFLLKSAKKSSFSIEFVRGQSTVCATFLYEASSGALAPNESRSTDAPVLRTMKVWLAPKLGYLPVKLEELAGGDGATFGTSISMERDYLDFRECSPGLWFPTRVVSSTIFPDRIKSFEVKIEKIQFNDTSDIPQKIDFPVGTYVEDLRTNTTYVEGPHSKTIDSDLKAEVSKLRHLSDNIDSSAPAPLSRRPDVSTKPNVGTSAASNGVVALCIGAISVATLAAVIIFRRLSCK